MKTQNPFPYAIRILWFNYSLHASTYASAIETAKANGYDSVITHNGVKVATYSSQWGIKEFPKMAKA